MIENISKKDILILKALERNARQPLKKIGKSARVSAEVAAYRLRRMEQSGQIICHHAFVNYFRLGLFKYKLYLRLKSTLPQDVDSVCQYFGKNPKTEWVAHMSGRWDIMVTFIVSSPNEFADEIKAFMHHFSEQVMEKTVAQTLYLAYNQNVGENGNEKTELIAHYSALDMPKQADKLDQKILQTIANNARMPIKHIAKRAGCAQQVAAYRLKRLEEEKVILAYMPHLEPARFGRTFYKINLYFKAMDQQMFERFMRFHSQLPGLVWPQQVLGSWDFELDLDVADVQAVCSAIQKIQAAFPDAVSSYEQSVQIKEYKLSLYPDALAPIR